MQRQGGSLHSLLLCHDQIDPASGMLPSHAHEKSASIARPGDPYPREWVTEITPAGRISLGFLTLVCHAGIQQYFLRISEGHTSGWIHLAASELVIGRNPKWRRTLPRPLYEPRRSERPRAKSSSRSSPFATDPRKKPPRFPINTSISLAIREAFQRLIEQRFR